MRITIAFQDSVSPGLYSTVNPVNIRSVNRFRGIGIIADTHAGLIRNGGSGNPVTGFLMACFQESPWCQARGQHDRINLPVAGPGPGCPVLFSEPELFDRLPQGHIPLECLYLADEGPPSREQFLVFPD